MYSQRVKLGGGGSRRRGIRPFIFSDLVNFMMLPAEEKTYYGFDDGKGAVAVFVSAPGQQMRLLPLGCKIVNHSPTGFGWGMPAADPRNSHWRSSPIISDAHTSQERSTSCSSLRRFQEFRKSTGR
jgi:hypothetical protein